MTERAPATAHTAAEDLRSIAASVEDFLHAVVNPTIDHNEDFITRGDARTDPYARLIVSCLDLMPSFVQALRMRAEALSPAAPVIPATPPIINNPVA